ncbi:MAG: family 43 glycosylhydrolase [Chloroflexi bacterium]|nr:family 43 glycosylhydrolase [Chloroflexota bacterium]
MLYADTSRGRPFSKDPAVVRWGGRYLLYYSLPPHGDGRPGDGYGIGIAASPDLEHWERVGEIPPEGEIEGKGICAPGAIVLGSKIHLFYQTYGNWRRDAICHAWSEDGLGFQRDPTNPIFRPAGDWNAGRAIDADVVARDGTLYLYWATRDPTMTVQMLGVATAPLDSDFSRAAWTQRCDAPILRPELDWEQECIEAPATCIHERRFYLFYGGAYNCKPQQIGCAVSEDGLRWRRLSNRPLLAHGAPGAWNACESGHPYVLVDDDGSYHLFYQGSADMGRTWYLSRAAIGWKGEVPCLEV